jgi:F0F1-type ATP synthase membrane subunit c/vacuolar-type H+-ATPase subunit K
MEIESAKLIAGAIVTLPAFGAALGLGMHFKAYNEALARNPEIKADLDAKYFLSMAFIEALGIIPIGIGAILLLG